MTFITLTSEQVMQELADFNERLASGVRALSRVERIEVGVSASDAVLQHDQLVLYRFRSSCKRRRRIPLLIVYSLVNRPYMMDLEPGRSMIEGLLAAGIDVYMIDWGYAGSADCHLTMEDYIAGYLLECVDHVRQASGSDSIDLLGVCQGGTFSLCFSALYPNRVRNLVVMVTPVDFHTPDNLLTNLIRCVDIDMLVDTLENIPGEVLNFLFLSLNPFRLTGQKYVNLVDILDDPGALTTFLRMEKWLSDNPAQAGATFRKFAKDFFQDNKLIKGEVQIGQRTVGLQHVTMPVLNVYATQDYLVPPEASRALARYCGSADYSELSFVGGHVGIYVSGRAQHEVPPAIAAWLKER